MFSLKCFFDDMWWMHGWCLYWRFVPCGNCVQNQVHTHTHVTPSTTKNNIDSITININSIQSITNHHSKNFLQSSPTPRNHSKFQWLPRIAWNWVSQLPVSVFRLLYKPYQPATRLGFCVLPWQNSCIFVIIHIYIYINVPAKVIRKLAMKLLKCTINPTW